MDQSLVTASIMNRGLCNFPESHRLRKQLDAWLTRMPSPANSSSSSLANDTLTCISQDDAGKQCLTAYDRNKDEQCQWVHFRPNVTQAELESTYETLASRYPNYITATQLLENTPKQE